MKPFLLLLLISIVTLPLLAQPNFKVIDFEPKGDKKPSYYARQAKKYAKGNDLDNAILCAAYGLEIADKKKDISNSQEILRDYFRVHMQNNLEKITRYKAESDEFVNDRSVTLRAEILNMYIAMNKYNKVLMELPAYKFDAVKKKETDLELTFATYEKEENKALIAFEKGKRRAADMHFINGSTLRVEHPADKRMNRRAARSFKYASGYIPNYRNADQEYLTAKAIGTVSVGIMPFKEIEDCGNAEHIIPATISGRVRKKDYEFVEIRGYEQDGVSNAIYGLAGVLVRGLTDSKSAQKSVNDAKYESSIGDVETIRKSDYVLTGRVLECKQSIKYKDNGQKEFSEEVVVGTETYKDAEGNEKKRDIKKTVKAIGVSKMKTKQLYVKINYKLRSKDGRIVYDKTVEDSGSTSVSWYEYKSGDKRAWDSSYAKVPKMADLKEGVCSGFGSDIGQELSDFVQRETAD